MYSIKLFDASGFRLLLLAAWIVLSEASSQEQATIGRLNDPPAPPGKTLCSKEAEDVNIGRLCSWLQETCHANGLQRIFFADFMHGGFPVRGLGVVEDIPQGSDVFCVPEMCWLARHDQWLSQLSQSTPSERISSKGPPPKPSALAKCHEYEKLAIWLAQEKQLGDSSFFYPYLAALPRKEDFERFHPAYLEGYNISDQIDYWKHWLDGLRECHAGRENPTIDETKLAYVQLVTRQFRSFGLVPLADMMNSAPRANLNVEQSINIYRYKGKTKPSGDFCIKAKRNLVAGEELLNDYGGHRHSPMLMFVLYGFAFDKGDHFGGVIDEMEKDRQVQHKEIRNPDDDCAGLRPEEFAIPADAGPVLRNYQRFADRFCRGAAEHPTVQPKHVDL